MQYLGKNLRRLRLSRSLTQDQLAEVLGVSAQAVSRWERSETYPDVTMLPAIANYYNVTLDELYGMNELRSRERMDAVYREVHELEAAGNFPAAITLLRRTASEFPDHFSLKSELALALTETGEYEEAIYLSEAVLDNSVSEKVRSTARANLCRLYVLAGMTEKASALAGTLPHVWESREVVRGALGDHEEKRHAVMLTLSVLAGMCDGAAPYALGAKEMDIQTSLSKLAAFLS